MSIRTQDLRRHFGALATALAIPTVVVLGCGKAPPAERPHTAPPIEAPAAAPSPPGDLETVTLRARVAELTRQVEEARARTRRAQESARQYRVGIARAVAELNRLKMAIDQAGIHLPPAEAPEPFLLGTVIETPTVEAADRGVRVHGQVHNDSRSLVAGELEVEVLQGTSVLASEIVFVTIDPERTSEYTLYFEALTVGEIPLQARASWIE